MYSGVSMLTLIPLPKVPSTLPPDDLELAELILGLSAKDLAELEVERAVWTAELI